MLRGQSPDEPSRWGGKRREDRIGEREEKRERKKKMREKKGETEEDAERERERGSVESGSEREEEMKLKSGRRTPLSGRVQHVI